MYSWVALQEGQFTAPGTLAAVRPTTNVHGVDTTTWRTGAQTRPNIVVLIDGTAPATVPAIELWGFIATKWYFMGFLNVGGGIEIVGPGQGYATITSFVGIASRLALVGTPSVAGVTYRFAPLDVRP